MLRQVLAARGIPLAVYRDRSGIFERRPNERWTLEEELAGAPLPTQVGRCFQELGIRSIAAHSPQAKGRVERVLETFQGRLVVELRLAGADTPEAANLALKDYLPRFNARFGVKPRDGGAACRPLPAGLDLDTVCCFKYSGVVGNDNTVTLGEHRLQIQPDRNRQSYARARVEVHERLDGSLAVYCRGRALLVTPAPPTAPVLRARNRRRVRAVIAPGEEPVAAAVGVGKSTTPVQSENPPPQSTVAGFSTPRRPAPDHPWRNPFKTKEALTNSLNT